MSDPDFSEPAAVVVSWDEAFAGPARKFANAHRLPIINETPARGALRFHLDANGWALFEAGPESGKGFSLRFEARHIARGKDPLLRAMARARTVLDLTAGWGADALHIARSGCAVVAVERNPVVFCLLRQAHEWLEDRVLAERIRFLHLDAAHMEFPRLLVQALGEFPPFDTAYIDPMFADKQAKSARARKPMYLMQRLVGEQAGANDRALLENAMAIATKRVVVKRALKAEPIDHYRLQGDIRSKLLRFDLYLP